VNNAGKYIQLPFGLGGQSDGNMTILLATCRPNNLVSKSGHVGVHSAAKNFAFEIQSVIRQSGINWKLEADRGGLVVGESATHSPKSMISRRSWFDRGCLDRSGY
jgi:hypothetical protein